MEWFSWTTVGVMLVVAGASMFIGAGIGHHAGYKRGYNEGAWDMILFGTGGSDE